MIQWRPWWWHLLHPIQSKKLRARNRLIMDDIARVMFDVFNSFDKMMDDGVVFDDHAATYYLKNQLHKEIYKVLMYHEATK